MKRLFFVVVFLLCICFFVTQVSAVSLSVNPSTPVLQGNPVDVNVNVSGLSAGTAPSLSVFDLNLGFNPSILAFSSITFGDPVLGDQVDLIGWGCNGVGVTAPGNANFWEVSFDLPADLDSSQADSFTLATLRFDTLAGGTSPLNLTINSLGDAWGSFLPADVINSSVVVTSSNPVPEPSTVFLLVIGFIGILGITRRRSICR